MDLTTVKKLLENVIIIYKIEFFQYFQYNFINI